jgi:hypothetical protein
MKIRIALALIVVLVSLLAVAPAFAEEHPHCESGAVFGQHHAEMAQAGELGADMNPGMHQGYSACLP